MNLNDIRYMWIRRKINPGITKRIPQGTYIYQELVYSSTQEEKIAENICLIALWTFKTFFNFQIDQPFVNSDDSMDDLY